MSRKGLDSWVNKLNRQDMPVVGEVIGELSALTGSDDADVNQLADVILRDPNLTSHVLRIANSVHYNYSCYPINTVSRAIVLIGFKGMRAICISSLIIDNFLRKGPRERLLQMMARALHAATQARNLMMEREDALAEEVFIAALLYHLGEMAFWASDTHSNADETEALLNEDSEARKQAMDDILGTSFKAITLELAKQWRLGETLEKALYPGRDFDPAVQAVLLGEQLSRESLRGWQSSEVDQLIAQMADFTGRSNEQTRQMVREMAEKAVDIARTYGAEEVCYLIPSSRAAALLDHPISVPDEYPEEPRPGDPKLQLNILRDLSMAATDVGDINTIMRMVVEGVHRGVGLPRVAVALIRKERLLAKYVLGEGVEHWRERFNFDVGAEAENLFTAALNEHSTHWLQQDAIKAHPEWHPPVVVEVLGRHEAFVSALTLAGRRVGVLYADAKGKSSLTQEQYDSFRHFANQAQMNLMLLSQLRAKKPQSPAPVIE